MIIKQNNFPWKGLSCFYGAVFIFSNTAYELYLQLHTLFSYGVSDKWYYSAAVYSVHSVLLILLSSTSEDFRCVFKHFTYQI